MANQAALGQAALRNSDFLAAINHYTDALKVSSSSPIWLIQRSTAYQRNKQYRLALADADNAVLAAIARGKRELIATAQFRRGVSLHGLGQFGNARMCFTWCRKSNEKEPGLTMWLAKVTKDYNSAGGDEAERNKITVKEVPDKIEIVAKLDDNSNNADGIRQERMEDTTRTSLHTQMPKENIRHEWFQSSSKITINILAKGIPESEARIVIQEDALVVEFPRAMRGSSYNLDISPLYSKVDPSQSSFNVTPHKIEIILHKTTPGFKWPSLGGPVLQSPAPTMNAAVSPFPVTVCINNTKAPTYPTSSLKGPRNWDAVADEALSTGKKDNEPEEVDDFFKMLYKNADPDTRRAMVKSYQESNGTHLSTSWADVKKAPVETSPPDGLVAKRWNE